MMQAVEFETVIHDHLITVPEKFGQFDHKKIRVLLLDTEEHQPIASLPEGFSHPLKVASYRLAAREEMYDR
ncbi:MAG: hypothetical protein GY801_09490 [bacterium]|nr:hypothetical protein [bacterium]